MKKNLLNRRRFKYGSLATIITVGFIVAVVLLNVVCTLLLERYPLSIDLTSDNRFKLTDESVEFVKSIDEDVTILVLADESTFEGNSDLYKQAYEIIRDYEKNNGRIEVQFVDMKKDPSIASKYPDESLNEADIIVQTGKRYKKFASSSLFTATQTQYGGYAYSSQAEQVMTSALMYATDSNPAKVVLLTGFDGADVSAYKELLQSNNYEVITQDLMTEELDSSASFLILPQPSADLTAAQVAKLENFLDNGSEFGKSLVFVASPTANVGPVLKNFLADWGLELGEGVIYETEAANIYTTMMDQSNFTMSAQLVDEDIAAGMKKTTLPVISSYSRPVQPLFENKDNRSTTVLVQTNETSGLLPLDAGEDFDFSSAPQSSYPVIVKASKARSLNNSMRYSNLLAIGSTQMLSANMLNYGGFANGDLMMTITNDIAEKKDSVVILPVNMSSKTITISDAQVRTNTIIFVFVIPAATVIFGIVVWLRRRHS